MNSPGRPAKDRGILAFGEQLLLPATVLLDTSFVAEALLSAQPHHGEAATFLARLAEHGTVVHFNRLLEVELAEVAFRAAIAEQHGRGRWRKLRHDGRVRRRADRLTRDSLQAWERTLEAFDYVVYGLDDVLADVPLLMGRHGLSSYDAVHAASGLLDPVEAVATLDTDFASLPDSIDLYTAQARVRSMRRHRGGQSRT